MKKSSNESMPDTNGGVNRVKHHGATTRGYVKSLHALAERRIRTVVDLGCGDWQFSKYVDWRGIEYHGYDP